MSHISQNNRHRVVITGVGLITPLGKEYSEFAANVTAGNTAISLTSVSDKKQPVLNVPLARVANFDPKIDLPNAKSASMDRAVQFSVFAAGHALESANVSPEYIDEVIVGTSTSGIASLEDSYDRLYRGSGRIPPMNIPKSMSSAAACATCIHLGITAASSVLSSACGSSNQALILAAQKISLYKPNAIRKLLAYLQCETCMALL